jgi:hypothetical protein
MMRQRLQSLLHVDLLTERLERELAAIRTRAAASYVPRSRRNQNADR